LRLASLRVRIKDFRVYKILNRLTRRGEPESRHYFSTTRRDACKHASLKYWA
jgi:hypothetical protein